MSNALNPMPAPATPASSRRSAAEPRPRICNRCILHIEEDPASRFASERRALAQRSYCSAHANLSTDHPCDVVEFSLFAAKCARCKKVRHDVSFSGAVLARSACCACVAQADSVQCKAPDPLVYPYISDVYAARDAHARAVRDAGDAPDEAEQAEIARLWRALQAACAELVRRQKLANVSLSLRRRFACPAR